MQSGNREGLLSSKSSASIAAVNVFKKKVICLYFLFFIHFSLLTAQRLAGKLAAIAS